MPWSLDQLGDAEAPKVVGGPDGTNFEAIAALEPDLILGVYADLSQGDYDKLSQIAPTIAQPEDQPAYGVAWDDQTRIIGHALGEESQALDLVEDVEGQSLEQTSLLDVDAIVWIINDRDTDVPRFDQEPLYASLEVHQGNHEVFVENLEPLGMATSYVSALSMPYLLENLVPQLATAVAGS